MATNAIIRTVGEAPIDGSIYGRVDGGWQLIPAADLGNFEIVDNTINNTDSSLTKGVLLANNSTDTLYLGHQYNTVEIGEVGGFKDTKINTTRVTTPYLTTALIDAGDDKTLTTKEWVLLNGASVNEAPATGYPYVRKSANWVEPRIVQTGITSTTIGVKIEDASAATGYTLPPVTSSLAGLMTAADKTNLNTNTAKVGVPAGGTTGQVLSKVSNTDHDLEWADVSGDKATGDQSITVSAGLSLAEVNTLFDNATKDLNGYTLKIQFARGATYSFANQINPVGFKNGFIVMTQYGAVGADPILQLPNVDYFIKFDNCSNVSLGVELLRFEKPVTNTTTAPNAYINLYNSDFATAFVNNVDIEELGTNNIDSFIATASTRILHGDGVLMNTTQSVRFANTTISNLNSAVNIEGEANINPSHDTKYICSFTDVTNTGTATNALISGSNYYPPQSVVEINKYNCTAASADTVASSVYYTVNNLSF